MSNDPLNLDEAGEWAGLWWLPDGPDEKVPGVLRYDVDGGLLLSLIGAFEDRVMSNPAPGVVRYHEGTRTWDVIHEVAERREITLLGSVPKSSKRAFGARVTSPDKQTVSAVVAIIGAHVRGDDDQVFAIAEVSVEDLGVWAASSVFEGFFGASGGKIDGTGRISVKPVEAQSVVVNRTEYRLVHRHTLPFFDQSKGGSVGRMRDTVSICVAPAEPFSLRVALQEASLVQDLISLATHRAAGVIWLQLEVAGSESLLPDGPALPRRRADVLYSPVALGKHYAKAVDHHRVLFTCDVIPFEEVLPRWFEAHDRLQAATNMILGLRYAPARFIENNLLTAVGAAEVLHRGLTSMRSRSLRETSRRCVTRCLRKSPRSTGAGSREPSATIRRSATGSTPSLRDPIKKRSRCLFRMSITGRRGRRGPAMTSLTRAGRRTIPSMSWQPSFR